MFELFFRAFDVDMLYIAQCLNIPMAEVAISWQEIEGMVDQLCHRSYRCNILVSVSYWVIRSYRVNPLILVNIVFSLDIENQGQYSVMPLYLTKNQIGKLLMLIKNNDFFLFISLNIYFGCSKEPSQ